MIIKHFWGKYLYDGLKSVATIFGRSYGTDQSGQST